MTNLTGWLLDQFAPLDTIRAVDSAIAMCAIDLPKGD
jgi:hypothetical protein